MKKILAVLFIALPILAETKVRDAITLGAYVNVCDKIGPVCPGTGDKTAALQAAINEAAANKRILYIPGGTFNHTALTFPGFVHIAGAGRQSTILNYTGAGTAFVSATPGTRIFDFGMRDLTVTTSTGAIGLDLDSLSTGDFYNLLVSGFSSTGIYIHSVVNGGAVYNRFFNVYVQSTPTCWKIAGAASNATQIYAGRANICSVRGFDIQDANDTLIDGSQVEGCGVGVFLDCAVLGGCDLTRLSSTRFESNTTGILVNSSNVRNVTLSGIYNASNGTDLTDSGATTRRIDQVVSVASNGQINFTGGSIVTGSSVFLGTSSSSLAAASATPLYLRGQSGNNGVGNYIGNTTTLTGSVARPACFTNDTPVTHASIASCVDINGGYVATGIAFANLATGSTTNGTITYCSDCTIANPCAAGGTGAFAKRLNGVWVCN